MKMETLLENTFQQNTISIEKIYLYQLERESNSFSCNSPKCLEFTGYNGNIRLYKPVSATCNRPVMPQSL